MARRGMVTDRRTLERARNAKGMDAHLVRRLDDEAYAEDEETR